MKTLKFSSIFLFFLLFSQGASAETLTGVIRNLNYEASKGFALDVPPLTRVYVNAATKFELPGRANQLNSLKEGDRVQVEATSANAGTYSAQKVKLLASTTVGKNSPAAEVVAKLREPFTLRAGQKAIIVSDSADSREDLNLVAKEFINTLCEGSNCAGEGDIGMRLAVDIQGKKEEILLISKNERKPLQPVQTELHGYTIQLLEAGEDLLMMQVKKN